MRWRGYTHGLFDYDLNRPLLAAHQPILVGLGPYALEAAEQHPRAFNGPGVGAEQLQDQRSAGAGIAGGVELSTV